MFGGVSLHVEIIKYQRIHSPPWRRLNKPFLTKFAPKMKRNWRWGPNKIRHNLLSAQLVLSYSPLPYCPLLRRQSVHVSLCLCLFCVPKLDVFLLFLLFLFQNSPPSIGKFCKRPTPELQAAVLQETHLKTFKRIVLQEAHPRTAGCSSASLLTIYRLQ